MDEWQWLTNPATMLVAVFLAWYFGKRNLYCLLADFHREADKRYTEAVRFHGVVNAQLQSLADGLGRLGEQVRQLRKELRGVRSELGVLRTEIRELVGEVRGARQSWRTRSVARVSR